MHVNLIRRARDCQEKVSKKKATSCRLCLALLRQSGRLRNSRFQRSNSPRHLSFAAQARNKTRVRGKGIKIKTSYAPSVCEPNSMRSFAHVGLHPRRHSERSEEPSVALRAAFCIDWILRLDKTQPQDDGVGCLFFVP